MRELRTGGQRPTVMRRRSALLVPLLVVAAACGSTTDTVDSVDTSSTTPSESRDAPVETVADAVVGEVPDDTVPSEGTAITQISPQAVPALTAAPIQPRETQSGEFPLDPASARVQATVSDLAERLGVSASDVHIVEAVAVTWGDSSLGCPQPGMQYLQNITDGSLVILNVDGIEYRYTGGSPLKLCRDVAGD